MQRCLVIYFSMGGATATVAESIAAGLQSEGYQCVLHNLKNGPAPDLKGYDLLGIGSPVYYFGQPFSVMDCLRSLSDLKGLPAFTFNTFGTYRFDSATRLRKILGKKGARPIGYFACHGTGTFLGYAKLGYLFSPDHPKAEDLVKAEKFGRELAGCMASNQTIAIAPEQSAPVIYWTERFLTNRWLTRHFYSRLFTTNKQLCNMCGLCAAVCPTHNISKNKDNQPVWSRDCILCLNCETKCPKDAIKSVIDWPVFRPFLAYNVRRASLDKKLDHVRVKHARGKIQIL
jgi:flavodoxin/Fe-S-cluster-containing hydrogenase component 2